MLSGLFGRGTFLEPDVEAWHLETWSILKARFGHEVALRDTPVVLPTPRDFPSSVATGHDRALHVFDCVRRHMQIEDWPCRLEAQSERRSGQRMAEFVFVQGDDEPNGTFRIDSDGTIVITYAPDLLDQPVALTATFAHELAHYLLSSETDLVEDETHELMTDLTVAYTGMGVFGANAAFSFQQHGDAFGQGWQTRSSGYLSPRSWAFALAVFGELRGDDGGMGAYLKPEIETLRRQAIKYLRKSPALLAPLRD